MSCITFIFFFQTKYYNDTYSFSRVVNNTCFAIKQHCNRMSALCIWGYRHVIIPQSQYLKCPRNSLTLCLCLWNFVPFLL